MLLLQIIASTAIVVMEIIMIRFMLKKMFQMVVIDFCLESEMKMNFLW